MRSPEAQSCRLSLFLRPPTQSPVRPLLGEGPGSLGLQVAQKHHPDAVEHREEVVSPSEQQDLKDSVNSRTVSLCGGVTFGELSPSGTVPRKAPAVTSPRCPAWYSGQCHCVMMSSITPGMMSLQVSAPPGMTSLWSKTIHSQPTPPHVPHQEPMSLGPVCPRAIPRRSSSLAASQLCPAPHTCRPWAPDSLHGRVEQVELSAALIAGPDAGVPPQPLHGHGVALLESGHFVRVLAHDQTGIVLGRDARGTSGAGPPYTHACKPPPLSATEPPHTAVPLHPSALLLPSHTSLSPDGGQRGRREHRWTSVLDESSLYRCAHHRLDNAMKPRGQVSRGGRGTCSLSRLPSGPRSPLLPHSNLLSISPPFFPARRHQC